MKLKVIGHEAEEGGYWAEVPAIPGCATQADSFEELLNNLHRAIEGCLSADMRDIAISPGDLEVAARIAGHESTRTTQLRYRLFEETSLDEIGRRVGGAPVATSQNSSCCSCGRLRRRIRGAGAVCPGARSNVSPDRLSCRLFSTNSSTTARMRATSSAPKSDSTATYPLVK